MLILSADYANVKLKTYMISNKTLQFEVISLKRKIALKVSNKTMQCNIIPELYTIETGNNLM